MNILGKSPKWHLVYYLLAIFDVVAISFSIYLNHMIMGEFSQSIELNQLWSERLGTYTELGIMATRLNAPGNDVFNTGNIEGEHEKMEAYFLKSLLMIEEAHKQLVSQPEISTPTLVPILLDDFERSITHLSQQARLVFELLAQDKSLTAAEHMATMDNYFSEAFGHIAQLQTVTNSEQTHLLKANKRKADEFQSYELVVAFCIGFMVLAVTIYGHLLAQRLRRDQKEKHYLLEKTILNEKVIQQQLHDLSETAKAKDDFLANISHELRTPMNGIIGAAELLTNTVDDDNRHKYTSIISQSGKSLLHLINNLLDVSKMESGMLELELAPFDLSELFGEVENLMQQNVAQKKLYLNFDQTNSYQRFFHGDIQCLRQILINLVSNAVKFTEQGGVTIECQTQLVKDNTSNIILRVKDTGIGIKPQQLESIFSRFTQADGTTTRLYGGTGLGLAICKQLTDLMDGTLTIESSHSEGSVFTLELTLGHCLEAEIHHKQSNEKPSRNYQKKALLAEDNITNQIIISAQLKNMGIEIDIAADGEIALEYARNNHYDLILMDMQMPNMDGPTVARLIRNLDAPINNVPIIALTANATVRDRNLCISSGMSGFVSKPIHFLTLVKELDQYLIPNQYLGSTSE